MVLRCAAVMIVAIERLTFRHRGRVKQSSPWCLAWRLEGVLQLPPVHSLRIAVGRARFLQRLQTQVFKFVSPKTADASL